MIIAQTDARVQPWTMMIKGQDALVTGPAMLRRHVHMDATFLTHWQGDIHSAILCTESGISGVQSHQNMPDYEQDDPADAERYSDNPLLGILQHRTYADEEDDRI